MPRRTAQWADHRATSHSGLQQPGATFNALDALVTRARADKRLRGCTSALRIVAFARGRAGKDAAAIVNDGSGSWQERRVCYRSREPGTHPLGHRFPNSGHPMRLRRKNSPRKPVPIIGGRCARQVGLGGGPGAGTEPTTLTVVLKLTFFGNIRD